MKMSPRNWTPEEVISKNCRICQKRIYLDPVKKKFYSDPGLTQFHKDEEYKPTDVSILESVQHIERQNIEILSELAKLRQQLYRVGQDATTK